MLYIAWLKYKGRRYLIPDLIHRDCSQHKIWVVFQGHQVISHIARPVLIRGWYIYKFMQCMLWVDAIRTLIVDIPVSLISRHNEFFHRYLKYSEKIYGMCGSTQIVWLDTSIFEKWINKHEASWNYTNWLFCVLMICASSCDFSPCMHGANFEILGTFAM